MSTRITAPVDAGRAVLPFGVVLRPLTMHRDERGVFTEVFRVMWDTGCVPVQWNVARSEANILRGVHVHLIHTDYLVFVHGRASVGLCDLRRGSPTEGVAALIEMHGDELQGLTIPPGVAHGFYSHEPTMALFAVSEYWSAADELGCHWSDPALGIPWPVTTPIVSERDAALPSLSELIASVPHW
jgi:dTDP-4-dehydrorhamnose 3,5-epimerase